MEDQWIGYSVINGDLLAKFKGHGDKTYILDHESCLQIIDGSTVRLHLALAQVEQAIEFWPEALKWQKEVMMSEYHLKKGRIII